MEGQGISVTTRVVKACGFALFCSYGLDYWMFAHTLACYILSILALDLGFGPKSVTLTKSFVNA